MDVQWITTAAAVSGLITDLFAIAGYFSKMNEKSGAATNRFLNLVGTKTYSYLFVSATWVLLVVAWLLGFQPYGAFVTDREANQLIAVMMSLPVVIAFLFGISHLFREEK